MIMERTVSTGIIDYWSFTFVGGAPLRKDIQTDEKQYPRISGALASLLQEEQFRTIVSSPVDLEPILLVSIVAQEQHSESNRTYFWQPMPLRRWSLSGGFTHFWLWRIAKNMTVL
jgi:hypothetical protein